MLSKEILTALKSYTAKMQNTVTFVLQTGEHSKRSELVDFLTQVASASEHINLVERDAGLRSPLTFFIQRDEENTGIQFSGIPSGHEFNSLILAILWSSGTAIKLDDSLQTMVSRIQKPLHFEVFISLSCHNCPDVVQALNQFALLNANITTEMIDGGLFQDKITEYDIQGVPAVYVDGEIFANGKIEVSDLIQKLMQRFPEMSGASTNEEVSQLSQLPIQDVTVIGGGPAGVASAIYSARKGLAVTLIADRLGGQVKDTMGIENFVSVKSTTGPELTGNLKTHLEDYSITLKEHLLVDNIEQGDIKKLTLSSGEVIESKTVIIATGAKWRELGVPGEKENIGNGVAYCPHCDGPFFKGKDVAVIGGGNSGIEAALDLAGLVKSVTVFEFMPELKADKVLVERAESRANINILKNVATKEIHATDGKVSSIEYEHRDSGKIVNQDLSGVFVQIGLVPNSHFAKDLIELTSYGEIIVDDKCVTSQPGIFACGDVTTVPYKQIIIAMGEGSKASLSAFEYLLANEALFTEQEMAKAA